MFHLKLNKNLFPRRFKLILPLQRNQMRTKGNECLEKSQLSFSFTIGTSSNTIIIDDIYFLCKDDVGNVFAKYVGTQSGVKRRTI
jgi:hypothetical protein